MNALSVPEPASGNLLMQITPRPTPVMVRGAGSWLWDDAGNRYLDFIQGWAVNALGHCPPEISETLAAQAQQLITPSPALHNQPQLELAAALTDPHFTQVHFANSGAEANEAAVKLARKWGQLNKSGAHEIITTTGAFHGRTLAMMAASGKPEWDTMFPPLAPGFRHVPFGDLEAARGAITATTVAIMLEPIQGEAGVIVPPAGYLQGLRALADKHGLLLIFDEVQTGIGRTGYFYYHQHPEVGVRPDIMTLGKGIGAGVPLSAILATEAAACFEHGNQGGTYNGNPLMTAVGRRVVETVSASSFLANVRERSAQLEGVLGEISDRHNLKGLRGRGLLRALTLPKPAAQKVADAAFADGLIVNPAQPDVIRLMPSLRVTSDEVTLMGELLDAALNSIS